MNNISSFLCLLLSPVFIYAQFDVSGKVINKDGDPLIGVNILEKGTRNGAVTDVDGLYSLPISSPNGVLVFSYVGYKTEEIPVDGKNVVDIFMTEGITIGEIQVVGSRSYNRTATNSAAPIDVIDVSELNNLSGRVEINQIMQYAAPSFNATKQSGSDGADHIDPASLRGLGPDQTLVLINGKRRHQSSLINVFGTRGRGNTGTDLNAIPGSSIKRIEVLRDGAAAQYGSDAIAGVINIVLADQTNGISAGVTHGSYSTNVGEGYEEKADINLYNILGENRIDGQEKKRDGSTTKFDLNYGMSLGESGGFINIGTELYSKERTLRPAYPWRQGYGSAAIDQFQFMVNSAMPIGQSTELYLFATRSDRASDAYAFSRFAPGSDGDERTVAALYPNGFNPHITSKIIDDAITGGVKHAFDNGWNSDFSHSYGKNFFHYFITETNNASLGAASPTKFDAGGHALGMHVTSLDFSKYFTGVGHGLNLAFGTEFRSENFEIFDGEAASYGTYDTDGLLITNPGIQSPFINEFGQIAPGSSQGFPGFSPENEVDEYRTNYGLYGDLEYNASKDWLIGAAFRFENYSDFGNTVNFKLSSRYALSQNLALRASGSTGFRAPSLAQIHYNLVFNNIVAGRSLRTLLASNTSTVAKAFGIEPLKEETSTNLAAGLTYKSSGFSATIDFYQIAVEDRIILTDAFDATPLNIGVEDAQFFANGVDTKTSGVDFVLNYKRYLDDNYNNSISLGIAGNFNKLEIEEIKNENLNEYTFFGPFAQAYLKAAAPDYKLAFHFGFSRRRFDFNMNWTQFSAVELYDFQWVEYAPESASEAINVPGRDINLFEDGVDVYKSIGTLDFSVSYIPMEKIRLTFGMNNVFNTYPSPQFDGWTDQGGFNDSVQMGSDGQFLFGRLSYGF